MHITNINTINQAMDRISYHKEAVHPWTESNRYSMDHMNNYQTFKLNQRIILKRRNGNLKSRKRRNH